MEKVNCKRKQKHNMRKEIAQKAGHKMEKMKMNNMKRTKKNTKARNRKRVNSTGHLKREYENFGSEDTVPKATTGLGHT